MIRPSAVSLSWLQGLWLCPVECPLSPEIGDRWGRVRGRPSPHRVLHAGVSLGYPSLPLGPPQLGGVFWCQEGPTDVPSLPLLHSSGWAPQETFHFGTSFLSPDEEVHTRSFPAFSSRGSSLSFMTSGYRCAFRTWAEPCLAAPLSSPGQAGPPQGAPRPGRDPTLAAAPCPGP